MTPRKPVIRARPLGSGTVAVVWGLLSGIPVGILVLSAPGLAVEWERRALAAMGMAAFLLLCVAGCFAMVFARLGEETADARQGVACASCGYDLRRVPGDTCPECGLKRAWERPARAPVRFSAALAVRFAVASAVGAGMFVLAIGLVR